jgi:glucose uptake protein GlcU
MELTAWFVTLIMIAQAFLGRLARNREKTWRKRKAIRITLIPICLWALGVLLILLTNLDDTVFLGLGLASSILATLAALRYLKMRKDRTRIAYKLLLICFAPALQTAAASHGTPPGAHH